RLAPAWQVPFCGAELIHRVSGRRTRRPSPRRPSCEARFRSVEASVTVSPSSSTRTPVRTRSGPIPLYTRGGTAGSVRPSRARPPPRAPPREEESPGTPGVVGGVPPRGRRRPHGRRPGSEATLEPLQDTHRTPRKRGPWTPRRRTPPHSPPPPKGHTRTRRAAP